MANAPAGSDLTIKQLLDACSWKLKHSAPTEGVGFGLSCSDGLQARSECAELMQTTRTVSAHISALQNSFLPINSLPIEILSYIFARLQDEPEHNMNMLPPWPVVLEGWFKSLTQVCHHWRTTALSVPSLWRNIFETKGDFRRLQWFLNQSHPHPVRVVYITNRTGGAIDFNPVASLLSRNVYRLELLSIAVGDDICLSEFKDLFSISFPILRTLAVDFRFVDELPLAVTQLRAPELRRLSLIAATLDSIPRTSVQYLTHLHLIRVLNGGPALEELLTLLQHTCSLISLVLSGACPNAVGRGIESTIFQALPVVALPHLEHLHLSPRGSDDDAMVLLYKLELPISSEVIWDNVFRFSRDRLQNNAISNLPILSRIRFLLVTDITSRTQLQNFRLHTGRIGMARLADYMHTVPILFFAKGHSEMGVDPKMISRDYPALNNANELHLEIDVGRLRDCLQFLLGIENQDSENSVFPCLNDLFLWWDRGKSVLEHSHESPPLYDESIEMNELKQKLLKMGQAARTKSDGNTYNVHLREFTGKFDWKWMEEQAKGRTFA